MEASNVKAMREALEHVEKIAREFAAGNYYVSDLPKMLLDTIHPALAAPPRNCDVGTAEEQTARYYAFCTKQHHETCQNCPCHSSSVKCEMAWAQMPYEEGESDEQK